MGATGGLVVLLSLAIGIGSLSEHILRAPALWLANATGWLVGRVEAAIIDLLEKRSGDRKLRRFESWQPVPVDRARRILRLHASEVESASRSANDSAFEGAVYRRIEALLFREANREGEQADHRRQIESEASMRLTLAWPLIGLTAVLAAVFGIWFALLAPAPFVIAFQGAELRARCDAELEPLVWSQVELGEIASELRSAS
jgi:hypothetical protein